MHAWGYGALAKPYLDVPQKESFMCDDYHIVHMLSCESYMVWNNPITITRDPCYLISHTTIHSGVRNFLL